MRKIHQYTIMSAPTMAQAAALEALQSGDDDVFLMRELHRGVERRALFGLPLVGQPQAYG